MKKWQIAVGILLVFAVGTAAGAYGSRMIFKKRVSRVLHSENASGIRVIQRMIGRLDLSEVQRTSINKILDENNKKWETILQEYGPKIKTLYETVIEETKKELTPEQREEIEHMSVNVQRRLPPRTFSGPRSSKQPRSATPPDESSPPGMSQSFGPKPESDFGTDIVRELGLDDQKIIEKVQAIILEDMTRQESLRDEMIEAKMAAEEVFREEIQGMMKQTDNRLQELLTPEQMTTYRRLISPDDPAGPEVFEFDGPPETLSPMDRDGFRQEDFSTRPQGQPGKTQTVWPL